VRIDVAKDLTANFRFIASHKAIEYADDLVPHFQQASPQQRVEQSKHLWAAQLLHQQLENCWLVFNRKQDSAYQEQRGIYLEMNEADLGRINLLERLLQINHSLSHEIPLVLAVKEPLIFHSHSRLVEGVVRCEALGR